MATDVSSFRSEISPDFPGCTNAMLDKANLRGCIWFCERTLIWHELLTAIDLVADTSTYSLSPTTGNVVTVLYARHDTSPISHKTEAWLEDMLVSGWRTRTSTTPRFFYLPESRASIRLVYIPEEGDTAALNVDVALKPERTATSVEDFLYTDWLDAISYGARKYLFSMKTQPWFDPKAGLYYDQMFKREIGKAKAAWSTGFSGLQGAG